MMKPNERVDPTEVYAGNIVDVGVVKTLLEDAGIHAYLKDEFVGMLGPWVTDAGGAGSIKVLVAKDDVEAAKSVVDKYEKNIKPVD
jgi:hypothetical protein